jgi:hypothetical protein
MPFRLVFVADHGTTTEYRNGCRCQPCRNAEAAKKRRQRASALTGGATDGAVVRLVLSTGQPARKTKAVSKPKAKVVGPNEQAVLDQCAASPLAADQPATVAQAVSLAKILDDEACKAMWPTTSRQLHALMLALRAPQKKSRGRLARVQAMTRGKAAADG